MCDLDSNRPSYPPNLLVKSLPIFGLVLLLMMALSLWLTWRAVESVSWRQNQLLAASLVDQLLLQVHWESLETEPGFQNEVENLATDFAGPLGQGIAEVTFLYRPDAPRYPESGPGRPANPFEAELMARLTRSPRTAGQGDQAALESFSAGNEHFFYYRPIYAARECTGTCHGVAPPGGVFEVDTIVADRLGDGELMAVARISWDNEAARETIAATWNRLLTLTVVTGLLVMLAFCLAIRHMISRRSCG